MQENYEKLLERISRASNLEKEEIDRRVEAKRSKLSGLISKEGAAQVIAAELGISFDNEKLKLNELVPGMKRVNAVGKVIKLFPVREFNKNGREGKVANFLIADSTSNIKVVLWDTNHIELIEKGKVVEGSVIEVSNASMRDSELHLGSFSEFKLSNDILEDVKTERVLNYKLISDFRPGESVQTRAFVVQVFDPRFFEVCPQCGKKANSDGVGSVCEEHGKITPEKRSLINLVVDDGTDSIRVVLFHEAISTLGLRDLENSESLTRQKKELLGKELLFLGNVRHNKFFNTPELIIDNVKEVDLDQLLNTLEK